MTEFLAIARLESPTVYPDRKEMVKKLLSDHEAVVVQLRKDIKTSEEKMQT
jgi:starvation-inducible DNA-binding protein